MQPNAFKLSMLILSSYLVGGPTNINSAGDCVEDSVFHTVVYLKGGCMCTPPPHCLRTCNDSVRICNYMNENHHLS